MTLRLNPQRVWRPLLPLLLLSSASFAADITNRLESIRKQHDLPGLAIIVFKDGEIRDRAAVGIRKHGDPTPLTIEDQFHIGSCTKSMTATLAGMLVEEGKLKWTTTIAGIFPELKGKMDSQFEPVTLEQLLTHRGGFPTRAPEKAWAQAFKQKGTPTQQRLEFIEAVLRESPEAPPGSKYIYSNQGYAIAGAMLEKITGQPWETLITDRLFKPLKMSSVGFGPPGKSDKVTQPWGHAKMENGTITPIFSDNPPAIGPAGTIHCTLDDLLRYTVMHLHGEKEGGLLKPETFRKLHTPPDDQEYALGWLAVDRSWAGRKAYTHSGSNTMWFLTIWFAPDKDFAAIAATNIGGDEAFKACDEAISDMIRKWLKK